MLKMKKVVVCLLAVAMICCCQQPMQAQAAFPQKDTFIGQDAEFCYDFTCAVDIAFFIKDDIAHIFSSLTGYPQITDKVVIIVDLQQYKDGKWQTYKTFRKTEDDFDASVQESMKLPKGYKYRTRSTFYAYDGIHGESIVKTSYEVQHY